MRTWLNWRRREFWTVCGAIGLALFAGGVIYGQNPDEFFDAIFAGTVEVNDTTQTKTVNGSAHPTLFRAVTDTNPEVGLSVEGFGGGLASRIQQSRALGTVGSPSVVANGNELGRIEWLGYDGTDYATGAWLRALVSGTPGANDMPTELRLRVSPDGSQLPSQGLTLRADGVADFTGGIESGSGDVDLTDATGTVLAGALPANVALTDAAATITQDWVFNGTIDVNQGTSQTSGGYTATFSDDEGGLGNPSAVELQFGDSDRVGKLIVGPRGIDREDAAGAGAPVLFGDEVINGTIAPGIDVRGRIVSRYTPQSAELDTARIVLTSELITAGALSELQLRSLDTGATERSGAVLQMAKEQNWTATGTTQDGVFRIQTLVDGSLVEQVKWGSASAVMNETGAAYTYRFEGDTDADLLTVDGVNDAVVIGAASPSGSEKLHVAGDMVVTGTFTGTVAGNIDGSGSANAIPKFSDSDTLTDSALTDNGSTLEYTGASPKLVFDDPSGTTLTIEHQAAGTFSILRLIPNPENGTSAAAVDLFRTTNTTGTRTVSIFKGDGTSTETIGFDAAAGDAQFDGDGAFDGGDLTVGSAATGNVGTTTNPNQLQFTAEASTSITGDSFNSVLVLGITDDERGYLQLKGRDTGAGALIDLENAADEDTTVDLWRVAAFDEEFVIAANDTSSPAITLETDLDTEINGALKQTIGSAFGDGDTTPSVAGGNVFKLGSQTSPISVTALDDGEAGQFVTLVAVDADTDLTDGGTLKLSANWTPDADDTLQVVFDGANWHEVSRSAN